VDDPAPALDPAAAALDDAPDAVSGTGMGCGPAAFAGAAVREATGAFLSTTGDLVRAAYDLFSGAGLGAQREPHQSLLACEAVSSRLSSFEGPNETGEPAGIGSSFAAAGTSGRWGIPCEDHELAQEVPLPFLNPKLKKLLVPWILPLTVNSNARRGT
jgi:hypothetical protein